MAQNRSLEDTRKDAVDLLARGDFTAVIDLLSAGAADDPTGESEVLLGDAHFFSEAYGEAEGCYRAALSRAGAPAGITAKLERAAAGAATGLARGEAQREVFARLFARDRLLGGPDLPDPQEAPPDLRRRRDGFDEVTHDLKIRLGHAAGTLGSFVFHHLTDLVGSRGTNDAVWTNWHASGSSLPGQAGKAVQILKLAYMRESLFANNLVRPYPDRAKTAFYETDAPPPEWARRWRTPDGSWNNLQRDADGRYDPMVGAAYTRFFRNVGDDRGLEAVRPRANPATDPVSVRELSRALFAPKGERTYVPFLNLWAAVWIQFMNHDWISHGTTEAGHTTQLPLAPGDPLRARYDIDHLDLRGTPADPTREPSDGERPPTFINEVTHWWDGSQLYGSDRETQDKLRSHEDGKLVVDGDGLLPVDPVTGTEATGFSRNWWVALGAIHTLFVREHNAICDTLKAAHPSWGDEALFQTARLVNAAVMAKIHTIEWTPGILPNHTLHDGMSANWYGLVTSLFGGQRKQVLEEIPITNRELGGIIGNPQATFAKYGLSEEFTAVYRMHSLLPDALRIVRQGQPEAVAEVPLADIRHAASPTLIREHGIENIALSLGVQLAGALVHNNFPRALLDMSVPGEPVVDLGAIDLFRDRERGVPPYNQLRAELGLRRVPSFDELTEDPAVAATLRELYGQDADGRDRIDDMDLLVGTLCEGHRPPGFGFGETLFQVFILNASWRLLGDRFYTDDFREEVYTREGLDWIDRVTMKSVLLRHFPSLASTGLANVSNAFEPWDEGRLDPERHPLRAFDPALRADPWAGDAPRASEATAPAAAAAASAAGAPTAAAAANANANAGVLRFWLYRNIVALFTLLGFRSQRVEPIRPPGSEVVAFRPYAAAHPDMPLPGLYEADSFPASDDAVARLRRIKLTRRLLGLARRVAPRTTPPVPADESRFLASVYPKLFRRAWAQPPRVPAELGGQTDVVAALAIRGPFGSYLRRANDTEVAEGEAAADHYVVDVSWMREYEPLAGLARPGGKAVLAVRDGRLQTTAVHAGDAGDVGTPALLAGLNEDLTTFRHNISVHLTLLTSFALATTNRLRPAHPLRRLLHHCFHTVLIGNRELAELQLSGPEGFSATVFSHGHRELARMATEHLARFDVWDLEPDTQFARRGTEQTPFAYPYRDNVLRLWAVTREYVDSYVRLYYPDDAAVRDDAELRGWIAELDRLVPNGVGVPDGGATVEWLVRLCATVIHVSTVEHDVLNNVVWDYSTLSWIVPTVVPSDGSRMDQRRAFDLIATLIGTWKPYNMLLTADIPSLALDEPARQVMAAWIARLGEIQAEMASEPREPSLSYPANLNVSISN